MKSTLGVSALVLGVAAFAQASHASQVIAVVPGPGSTLDVGSLCLTSSALCNGPGTNATDLDLASPFPGITGDFVYTPTTATTGTISFTLTLTSNATFGSQVMLAGSTFTGTAINVSFSQSGSGKNLTDSINEIGQATGSASVSFASGLPVIENTPTITNLSCSFTASGGLCGVDLGGSNATPSGLQFGPDPSNSGAMYNGFLGFDANVKPVPLPPSLWLMLGGLGLIVVSRGRGAAALARAPR
jgi:hypothetical protein